jgi:tetratricopeptide (TPR) repeat protein
VSGEALYERYKDALRRGHVASLRGRLEEALTAYAEAATIAPERATPHTSAGTALMRRKRPADAVRHYTTAIRLAPRDEAALTGRAQALAALDKRPQAADAYDALADVQAMNGKLADAVDSARKGLELAEGRERRRTLVKLMERLRATNPGEPGRVALERALVVLEGRAIEPRKPGAPPVAKAPAKAVDEAEGGVDDTAAASAAAPEEPAAAAGEPATEVAAVAEVAEAEEPDVEAVEPVPGAGEGGTDDVALAAEADVTDTDSAEPDGAATEVAAEAIEAAAEPEPSNVPVVYRNALDRDLPADLDLDELARTLDRALETPADGVSLDSLLDLASGYRRDGRDDAALDTCYVALAVAPDDVALHLALVELYVERGWSTLAVEKLDLLDRIAALDGDAHASALVAGARLGRG